MTYVGDPIHKMSNLPQTTPIDFSQFEGIEPYYNNDMIFSLDGLNADEYIAKVTKEMNSIEFDSIPFDKWDYIVAFSLALLEVAGDFFMGDPAFKHSLANKNGPFCQWLNQFHDKLGHSGHSIDYQGDGFGGGLHRAKTFGHDSLPLARILYGSNSDDKDQQGEKSVKKVYNGVLLTRDILSVCFAIYQISSGRFIDCTFTKSGTYKLINTTVNQHGTPYESSNVFVAVFKYLTHMLADFCSSTSLPIPGFSILTHWPDRDVQAFALKLYKNGMNLRTMALGGIPVGIVEIFMRIYIHLRYKDSSYSENQQAHKLNKLLLLTHGITSAVNIGKVIISKNPARLNIILVARTCHLVWKVITEELRMTNRAIEKAELGILKARIESMNTLILLDKTIYETAQYDRLIKIYQKQIRENELEYDKEINLLLAEFDELNDEFEKRSSYGL